MTKRRAYLLAAAVLGVLVVRWQAPGESATPSVGGTGPSSSEAREKADPAVADWLVQASVRSSKASATVATAEDAAGGCDGIKDGKWGFHTALEKDGAWWQVDLGKVHPLTRVVVYNRCDTAPRTAWIELLLSNDAKTWTKAYRHDGKCFYGFTDGKPLIISLSNAQARFVRLKNSPGEYFHLDEVEVYGRDTTNLALHRPADQSSVSQWSTAKARGEAAAGTVYPIEATIQRGRELAADLRSAGVAVEPCLRELDEVERAAKALPPDGSQAACDLYLRARAAVRKLAMSNPLLDFDRILFVKRAPASYSHMSDQYYSWWARPGGGVCVMEGFKTDSPQVRCLTGKFPEGSFLSPDLSYDGKKVLFSYCRYYPGRAGLRNKLDKEAQAEDGFYHIFEMNADGTGLRQLTRGRYDDTFPRYLPSGEIVFISTRRGTFFQCGKASAAATTQADLPDSFVRCGGDSGRPVSIYTLHVMDASGGNMRAISAFESFEWEPSVAEDGRIYYARWDYVDRSNMPFMKLWSTNPDGTSPQAVYGNFTRNPHCIFEPRSIPGSRKLICTASGHHAITAGSLVLLDPTLGIADGPEPVTRLTPEVCFPETEGWPRTYYVNPYPLSERYYLVGWSSQPIHSQGSHPIVNAVGLYLCDAFGNLELLYRDPNISCMYPIPVRPRAAPPALPSTVDWNGPQEGRFLVQNVYEGLDAISPGSIKRLRIVGMPVKTQPNMNTPSIGVTNDDPGKCILGTVPVEKDGSTYFRVPSGVAVFFQALNADGKAIQTMRSLTYVQPGQTASCIGCHEGRNRTPPVSRTPLAASREPSKLKLDPEGSWPLRFDKLVQPVLDKHCTDCHRPGGKDDKAAKFDLTAAKSYANLLSYGRPSLRDHVRAAYGEGRSVAGKGAAQASPILAHLNGEKSPCGVRLDEESLRRLAAWMDTYGQKQGSFSPEQEEQLLQFRRKLTDLLEP